MMTSSAVQTSSRHLPKRCTLKTTLHPPGGPGGGGPNCARIVDYSTTMAAMQTASTTTTSTPVMTTVPNRSDSRKQTKQHQQQQGSATGGGLLTELIANAAIDLSLSLCKCASHQVTFPFSPFSLSRRASLPICLMQRERATLVHSAKDISWVIETFSTKGHFQTRIPFCELYF